MEVAKCLSFGDIVGITVVRAVFIKRLGTIQRSCLRFKVRVAWSLLIAGALGHVRKPNEYARSTQHTSWHMRTGAANKTE